MSIDPQAIDPAEFARQVGQTPDEQLRAGMASEARDLVLGGIFDAMCAHFDAEKAKDAEAVVHWRLGGRADGEKDVYEVVIESGVCTVTKEPQREPKVTFSLDAVDFLKLVTGNESGPSMFMFGKLRVSGDLMFAAGMQSLFRMPT